MGVNANPRHEKLYVFPGVNIRVPQWPFETLKQVAQTIRLSTSKRLFGTKRFKLHL